MKIRRGRSLTALIVAACAALTVTALTAPARADDSVEPRTDSATLAVVVTATLHLQAFERASLRHHHLLTFAKGRAAGNALLTTEASDGSVLDALVALGGKPGDNLREEAWTERANPKSKAPDVVAKGTALEVSLLLSKGKRPIEDLLVDVDRRGFAWTLAGNRALIPVWKSGCVICLQSCPGSKIANAKATMRDLHRKKSRFEPSALAKTLGEGAVLRVEMRLVVKKGKKKREAGSGEKR